MEEIICEGCGKVLKTEVEIYGDPDNDWTLCFSCDWEHQMEYYFDDTTRRINEGRQISFLEEKVNNDATR